MRPRGLPWACWQWNTSCDLGDPLLLSTPFCCWYSSTAGDGGAGGGVYFGAFFLNIAVERCVTVIAFLYQERQSKHILHPNTEKFYHYCCLSCENFKMYLHVTTHDKLSPNGDSMITLYLVGGMRESLETRLA
jgi:hypothetical protein